MNTNEQLIHTFYTAFAAKDFKTMQQCYADTAVFSDAVFKNLNAAEVKAMWHMLCESGKDLVVNFSDLSSLGNSVTCRWDAYYTFSLTGKKVHNIIAASFEIQNGKIVSHVDKFNFWRWSSMALGLSGKLLGWTPFLNKKVSMTAMGNLKKFMEKNYRS
ncbi:MAG: nuclear transport factor 2 family protein [Bacteroidota bacterium]|nr:nuclear transport factor 2 family protein [Bacteroidota bacterium]